METFQMKVFRKMIHQPGGDCGFWRAARNTMSKETTAPGKNVIYVLKWLAVKYAS